MIAVIADDFTGAAEIGGIGLRHGLNVIIETRPVRINHTDLLVIATDTRSMGQKEAADHIRQVTAELMHFNPEFIYKKIDSVLRGNITRELVAQMDVSGKARAVIIAANPVFDRFIRDGRYYIGDTPLHETHFASDTQYPIRSSDVLNILVRVDDHELIKLKPDEALPARGLIIGDVQELQDLGKWARHFDEETLFAGASGFFNSLLINLDKTKEQASTRHVPFGENILYIMGSTYPKNQDILKEMAENGHYISNMPEELYYTADSNGKRMKEWVDELVSAMNRNHKAVVSVIHARPEEAGIEHRIKNLMASLVKEITDKVTLHELLIEGGSTTSEILKSLDITRLTPFEELETGVIRMEVDTRPDLFLTTKPGSYAWPEKVWMQEKTKRSNAAI